MSEHTPGPWEASGLTVYDTCMDSVASVHSAADAHLIAAAPDMLDALKEVKRLFEYRGDDATAFAAKVEAEIVAAIAKAEGRP